MKKHIFFDLDETLTPSRLMMEPLMQEAILELLKNHHVIVVSGSSKEQMKKQLPEHIMQRCFLLCQNGNYALDAKGDLLWEHKLSENEQRDIHTHIKRLISEAKFTLTRDDHIEERGCQITFSPVGCNADLALKKAFDPDKSKRIGLLQKIPLESDTIEVKVGGTTCFDYYQKGSNKGANVAALIEYMGWKKDESLYVGDALMPGGNDETVVGVIDTHAVKDQNKALEFVRTLLS